jgi:hypothetical protein
MFGKMLNEVQDDKQFQTGLQLTVTGKLLERI